MQRPPATKISASIIEAVAGPLASDVSRLRLGISPCQCLHVVQYMVSSLRQRAACLASLLPTSLQSDIPG